MGEVRRPKSRPWGGVLKQVILKVAQRCNLDCTYCYVYNRGDDSWRRRPPVISERVVRRLSERIAEHCADHGLSRFTVELHGGEPLLVGRRHMRRILEILSKTRSCRIDFVLQTNGLLLDTKWIELFDEFGVSFGVSLDGPPHVADRRRIMRADGSGSTEALLERLHRLRDEVPVFEKLFGGCLCVIDTSINGGELVDWFVGQGFDDFDLLLPNGNRANLPDGWIGPDPYYRFLIEAFDRWYGLGAAAPRIRKFELMMSGLLGGEVHLDSLGGDLSLLAVIESDGSIGISDVARLCGGACAEDTLNIFDDPLAAHTTHYRIQELQMLCDICVSCPNLAACGGGYLPHRYDGRSFLNTSLYCSALFGLAEHMRAAIRRDVPAALFEKSAVSPGMETIGC